MIAIPNTEKPKRCGECDLWSNCFYPKNPYTEQDDYIAPDCELIDIVTCGECIWKEECTITELWGGRGFCPSGERKSDPNKCKECELANTCDHHICLIAVRERRTDEKL